MNELLNKIKYYEEKFHKKELQEIINNKEEAIPMLLDVMKNVRDNYEKYLDEDYFIHIYATYLLAQFRVSDFYEIIIDVARLPEEIPHDLYGDTITEALGRIIASVYNGNLGAIYELIEDRDVDEYVRGQGIQALTILTFEGMLEREKIVEYLKDLLIQKTKEKDYRIVTNIINGLTDLYPEEAIDEIKLAYENDMVDEGTINLNDVQRVLGMRKEKVLSFKKEDRHFKIIGDIEDEIGWWYCFNKIKHKKVQNNKKKIKIGRNDSCPCSSGKKYKKCCGKNL